MKSKMKKNVIPDQLNTLLMNVGLTEKEATIYEVLLSCGMATASEIMEASGLKRGITYAVLYSLEKKKLITSFEKESKTCFQVEPPNRLMDLVEERKQQVEIMENSMKHVIKDLTSQYKLAVGKPTVQYFEGKEGLQKVFENIFSQKGAQVYGCANLRIVEQAVPTYIEKDIVPTRLKNDVTSYAIFNDETIARTLASKNQEQKRETIFVDEQQYPMPAEIDVYEDKIAMLSFDKGEFIGLIIENKSLAETLRSVFKLAFSTTDAKVK